MTTYIFNTDNKVVGHYENEELNAEGIDAIAQRDFTDYKSATTELEIDTAFASEEELATATWTANLIDTIQSKGLMVAMLCDHITIWNPQTQRKYADGVYVPGIVGIFNNWSEVESWLNGEYFSENT